MENKITNELWFKVTGLVWDIESMIANNQISEEKLLWLIPDGAMLSHPGRKQEFTKELLEELGLDVEKKMSTAEIEYDDEEKDDTSSTETPVEPTPDEPTPELVYAVWDYIWNEETWNAAYNKENSALAAYYENNPSEDLWNTTTDSAPGFNDKIYTVSMWTNAECEGEAESRQFKAQYYSDGHDGKTGVQQIIDVNDPEIVYFIPLFFSKPSEAMECFSNVEGGYNGTVDDLVGSCSRWIIVDDITFGGDNVHPCWKGFVNAGAVTPWCVANLDKPFTGKVYVQYDENEAVYPWGNESKTFTNGYAICSIPTALGAQYDAETFDDSKFKVILEAAE